MTNDFTEICPVCNGEGTFDGTIYASYENEICLNCWGTGKVRKNKNVKEKNNG